MKLIKTLAVAAMAASMVIPFGATAHAATAAPKDLKHFPHAPNLGADLWNLNTVDGSFIGGRYIAGSYMGVNFNEDANGLTTTTVDDGVLGYTPLSVPMTADEQYYMFTRLYGARDAGADVPGEHYDNALLLPNHVYKVYYALNNQIGAATKAALGTYFDDVELYFSSVTVATPVWGESFEKVQPLNDGACGTTYADGGVVSYSQFRTPSTPVKHAYKFDFSRVGADLAKIMGGNSATIEIWIAG